MHDFVAGLFAGLGSGFASGLLGVSPGGGLVVFCVLLLNAEQHTAQAISLLAQVFPTSTVGVRRYWQNGIRTSCRWIGLLGVAFVIGGLAGAYGASRLSSGILRWAYVAYLVLLDIMLVVRGSRDETSDHAGDIKEPPSIALLAVGLVAGLSSGFLGIGGGLATVVGLSALLRVPQHQAQMVSLILALIPATAPSAWVYWQHGWSWSWVALLGVVGGLLVGTDVGARFANKIKRADLHYAMIAFVTLMAAYMAYQALQTR